MRRLLVLGCMISVLCFPLSNAWAKKPSTTKTAKSAADKPIIVSLTIKGGYPEGPESPGLFSEMQSSLAEMIERMDAAAADQNVRAVWLKIESAAIGRGKLCEMRGAVARLRKAGKPVYAEMASADTAEYLLASACDTIVMPPSGELMVAGVRAEITFYKGLLDKLGLEMDVLKMGKYKGALEPFSRNEMSKPLRESYEALVDDYYTAMLATIASDRRMKDYQVKTYVDRGLFMPSDALKAGLIDEVLYSDQIQAAIAKRLKIEKIDVVSDYKSKKIDADFSGLSGLLKLVELISGGKPSEKTSKKQKIAVVYAVGQIVEGKSEQSSLGGSSLGSTTLIAALRKAAADPKIAAVVLRIDSPGGSATASDLIWRETMQLQLKKPLIASMSDVAGSGGYYIAMGAKKIYAAPGTLTGSIGVIGGKLVTRGLYDKLGLHTEVISRGANAGSMSSNQPFTPEERKVWTETLQDTYHQFVSKAAEGRKMSYDKLESLAQGRVYTGRMAKELGLIDELGTLADAVAAAKAAAGLKADADVDLIELPEPKTIFEQLFGDPAASSDLESLLSGYVPPLRQTKTIRRVLSEKILTWMPYGVQIQ